MGSINASVDLRRDGDVAVVTADNPPVNALKHEVRAGLTQALAQTHDEGAVGALSPERVILLPDGVEDSWSEDLSDLVALA